MSIVINPTHLKTLLQVLATGSFTAAAEQLGYTASAVSQQMSTLERDLQVTLFQRSAKSITPTPAAEAVGRHAKKVLTDLAALAAAGQRHHSERSDQLRVALFSSLAGYAIPRLLADEAFTSAGVELQLLVAEPHDSIERLQHSQDVDIALVFQVGQTGLAWPHRLERSWLGEEEFRVVLPKRWGIPHSAQVEVAQLAEMPWLMHHPGTADATVIERLFTSCGINPSITAFCDDFSASLNLCAAGMGAALVPDLALEHRIVQEKASTFDPVYGTVIVDVPEVRLSRSIFALTAADHTGRKATPASRLFLDRLAAVLEPVADTDPLLRYGRGS